MPHPSSQRKVRIGTTQVLLLAFLIIFVSLLVFIHLLTITSNEEDDLTSSVVRSDADAQNVQSAPIHKSDQSSPNNKQTPPSNSYHFLISSDCTSYQRWEVLTQLHSAQHIRQCGRYTWIVSGCLDEANAKEGIGKGGANSDKLTEGLLLEEVERHFPITVSKDGTAKDSIGNDEKDCHTIHPHVHFTPDYMNMSVYGGPFADGTLKRSFLGRNGKLQHGNFGNTYPFNNKPNGLNHWIRDFLNKDERRDEVVVLIDPDFLFLNKFELEERVLPGKPAAAKYGLGAQVSDTRAICFVQVMTSILI